MRLIRRSFIVDPADALVHEHHASSPALLPDGRLAAAWFGGTREHDPDVEIWYAVRNADGQWSRPAHASVPSETACWNPALHLSPDGTLTLYFKRGEDIEVPGWRTFVRTADAAAVTPEGVIPWSDERELVPGDRSGGRGPVKNKPLLLSDGSLLAGASHEYPDGSWRAFADRSDDGGRTWTASPYIPVPDGVQLIQPTLWEDADGVHCLMRSRSGYIFRADSRDGGRTWGEAYPTDLIHNNSGIDLVQYAPGCLALACNPTARGRCPLSLFISTDGGAHWTRALDLADEARDGDGEYSYPAVITDGRLLYVSFTYRRQGVMLAEIEI